MRFAWRFSLLLVSNTRKDRSQFPGWHRWCSPQILWKVSYLSGILVNRGENGWNMGDSRGTCCQMSMKWFFFPSVPNIFSRASDYLNSAWFKGFLLTISWWDAVPRLDFFFPPTLFPPPSQRFPRPVSPRWCEASQQQKRQASPAGELTRWRTSRPNGWTDGPRWPAGCNVNPGLTSAQLLSLLRAGTKSNDLSRNFDDFDDSLIIRVYESNVTKRVCLFWQCKDEHGSTCEKTGS